ncbi:glycosyl hydrolase family 18 protein [Caloranaerobacter azorensis]|uniref:SH3 domain-containing protein n=1 Tax=Caloranaerobacter azorensis TaxID=116090 RepID=A0A6P1YE35_9FIRM|nr:glycosyl hydrolase family 18 protein [Caloranaerobacter azorensis]QIB27337.1 SH3 domain-containing protein [Caloranaerobacter azorensis]
MLKKGIIFVFIVAIMTLLSVLGLLYFKPYEHQNIASDYVQNRVNIVIEDIALKSDYSIIDNDKIYIPVEIIKKYLNSDIVLDKADNRLYLEIRNPVFKLETEKLDNMIRDGIKLNFLTVNIDDKQYLNIRGLEKIFDIDVNYIKETNTLIIDRIKKTIKLGEIKSNAYLRPKKSSFSFVIDKLHTGDKVVVFEEYGKWYKVRTQKGYIGYVLNKVIDVKTGEVDINRKINNVRRNVKINGKINLVWDYVYKYSKDLSKENKIEGLNVISPTWFSINSNGYIINNGDFDYVNQAHKKGYKVWALIDNQFDKNLTRKFLKSKQMQENLIKQLAVYSSIYDLDGINIDFENVYYEDKDKLTEFVRRLTDTLKQQNIIISMDMTVPSTNPNWSKFYDRKKLGKILDYCIVMTYDEHWATSPKSGSVASIRWVMKGIENSLKYIPEEKLIMGLPFYTRQWEEYKDSRGKIKVKSKVLTMKDVERIIKENNLEVIWLEDVGQYYTEYFKEGKKYRIWIEDDKSIELKAKLIYRYNLAGIASWRKGFEKESIWAVLNSIIEANNKDISLSIVKFNGLN